MVLFEFDSSVKNNNSNNEQNKQITNNKDNSVCLITEESSFSCIKKVWPLTHSVKALDEYILKTEDAITLGNVLRNSSHNFQKRRIAVARTGVLHCVMGLPTTRKNATEEDRGEDNKDPDWLIEQSIARQVAGGVLHCATANESCCNRCRK